jgi:hypothetical protein
MTRARITRDDTPTAVRRQGAVWRSVRQVNVANPVCGRRINESRQAEGNRYLVGMDLAHHLPRGCGVRGDGHTLPGAMAGRPRGSAAAAASIALSLAAGLAMLAEPAALAHAQGATGLVGMAKVALEIAMARELPGLGIDTVESRLERALAEARPAPSVDGSSGDRLQVAISVAPVNSSELRGFYLPFSGAYGIGSVRLAVIRLVRVTGRQVPVPAIVWQAERQARGPWHSSGQEVVALLDELIGEFLDDYRRPPAP